MNTLDITTASLKAVREMRVHDLTRERHTAITNRLWVQAHAPRDEALQQFADAFATIVARTHPVKSCTISSNFITTVLDNHAWNVPWREEFAAWRDDAGDHVKNVHGLVYVCAPEISIHIADPLCDRRDSHGYNFVQVRRNAHRMSTRRMLLKRDETPEQIWARIIGYFDDVRLETHPFNPLHSEIKGHTERCQDCSRYEFNHFKLAA
jgi:hypothetical protein